MGIADRTAGAGEAPARRTEILAPRLADDGAAGIEDARHDGGVDLGDVTGKDRRAVHHRHPSDTGVVLDGDALASEFARWRARDFGDGAPGIVGVLAGDRGSARRAGIFHRRQLVGHRGQRIVAGEARLHQTEIGPSVGIRERDAEFVGDGADLVAGRAWHGHDVARFTWRKQLWQSLARIL